MWDFFFFKRIIADSDSISKLHLPCAEIELRKFERDTCGAINLGARKHRRRLRIMQKQAPTAINYRDCVNAHLNLGDTFLIINLSLPEYFLAAHQFSEGEAKATQQLCEILSPINCERNRDGRAAGKTGLGYNIGLPLGLILLN